MGGGGAMKAAAAGISIVNVGFRAMPSESQVRSASRQIPAMFSSSGEVMVGNLAAEKGGKIDAAEEKQCFEYVDRSFVGGDEKAVGAGGMGRVVFGGAPPTMQEAKEATAELKDALDKTFLPSPRAPEWGLSCVSKPLNTRIIDRVTHYGTPTVPKNALKAFTLLSGSPAAQTVVSSIACDPNVWSAVLQNKALVEFLQSNTPEENYEGNTCFLFKSSTSKQTSDYGEVLKGSMQSIKTKVIHMVTNLSDYFNDLFAVPVEEKSPKSADKDGDDITFVDAAKLMGLVVMVIAIIFLKRG